MNKLTILSAFFVTFTGILATADGLALCKIPEWSVNRKMDIKTIMPHGLSVESCPDSMVVKNSDHDISIVLSLTALATSNQQQQCIYVGNYNNEKYELDCVFSK